MAGLALLLPFTFNLDAYSAFAFMLGLGAVTSTSDTIPFVLSVSPAPRRLTTVLDGPDEERGSGRALGPYAALIGIVPFLLGLTIPVLRPILMNLYPIWIDALARFIHGGVWDLVVDGGWRPDDGSRWTLDTLYLIDDLPLLPVALGLFTADLRRRRSKNSHR